MTARRFYVRGIVQGVGYRYFVRRIARRIGVYGFVRNLPDGRVEVYAEGSPEQLAELRRWLWEGPPGAVVEGVDEREETPTGRWDTFTITF